MSPPASTRPATPRLAATIILVREQGDAFGVYLMQRSLKSSFMGGNYVFPGGKVDTGDGDLSFWRRHGDLSRHALAERLHDPSNEQALLAYAVAAIRETWEEAGVLLADLPDGRADLPERLQTLRQGQRLGSDWLRTHLVATRGALAYSALWPWSHWIAPQALKQRFDTRFFVARMPAGQTCRPDPRETPKGRWMTPRDALGKNSRGELSLSPPTLVTLHTLLDFADLDALQAALPRRGWGPALMPKMCFPKVGAMVIQPWDPAYADPEGSLPERQSDLERLPVGAAFSRLWNDKGTWRPVA